tara:strand:+ start:1422 stop:4556 length:3135 start_codon:yes stop_codon:yes gene_type:complete
MSGSSGQRTRLSNSISIFLVLMMTLHLYAPFASAANMTSCVSDCDEYDPNDDSTPHRKDWIEGTYDFKLEDTSTIHLELVWALREFDRAALGLDSPLLDIVLATDGLDSKDGAPADLIRDQFDTEIVPGVRVQDKLIIEIDKSIKESVESGFGEAQPSTGYVSTFTNSAGSTIDCSIDPLADAFDEGALENNAFEPPICLRSVMDISIDPDSFNLVSNSDLDLERAYQGLLLMGAEVTTMFDLVGLPGHKSSYSFNPPDYATIKSVDSNGTRAARSGPPSAYFAGEWEIDHRGAGENEGSLALPIEVEMMYRNSSDTTTVAIPTTEKALDFQVQLDLRDESAVTLSFVVALHYLDEATMTDWGISLMSVAERATLNQVTSDGIRLAYQNGIVNLSNITSQFPVDTIADGVSSAVAGMDTIVMNEMTWVSDSVAEGISGPAGGLNFTHRGTSGCTELIAPTNPLNYCLNGPSAMSYENPVYLQTSSQPFSMKLLDILKENNEQATVEEILGVLETEDFRRVMDAGLEVETSLPSSFLSGIIPSNLPASELTLEIILPTWIQTKENSDRIILKDSLYGSDEMNLSFAGTNVYDWRHVIKNDDGDVVCLSNQSTCVTSDVKMDAMSFKFNEWDRSVAFEFGIDASIAMHRIGIPDDKIPSFDEHSVSMAAIPSDLLRLGIDLSSRLDAPFSRTMELAFLCELDPAAPLDLAICSENITFTLSSQGLSDFVQRIGVVLTAYIHQSIEHLIATEDTQFKTIDLDAFEIQFSLDGIGAPGLIVSDQKGISLSMKVPNVKFKLAVDGDIGKMLSGEFDTTELSLTTNALRQTILWPMGALLQSFSGVLVNSVVSLSGITSPSTDDSMAPYSFPFSGDSYINEEFGIALNGPITIHLPKGIRLIDLESASGLIEERDVDGRQEITYDVPYGGFEDTISFRFQITWYFFFVILWKYMAIMVILSYLGVRRLKKKRAKKRARRNYSKARAVDKVSINPNEFADLSGFHSKGIHGEMETLKYATEDALPPLPPVSPFGISAVQHVGMMREDDSFD